MKKMTVHPYLLGFGYLFLLVLLILNGASVCRGMGAAVMVCLNTMIPSLYAMMIFSELFLSCGLDRIFARALQYPAKFLFGCSGQVLVIFLLSQVAGYPIGAKLLGTLVKDGQLTRRQASFLSGVCFGGGPAFLAGLFLENTADLYLVFLAGFLSNLILFLCMSRFLRADAFPSEKGSCRPKGAALLVEAACTSGRALLRICAVVILFGGILSLYEEIFSFLPEQDMRVIGGFAEISRITLLFPYASSKLPLLGAMLSFGGLCVLMQIAAIAGAHLHMGYVFLLRGLAAALTAGWIALYQHLFPAQETAAAVVIFEAPPEIQVGFPLPAFLLLVMTVMLLRSSQRI
ncbi:MAG: hypothetical protein IJ496_09965 [Ruminococcus sp.]|nr:hypothetical protein [Ruminococcus sp.]